MVNPINDSGRPAGPVPVHPNQPNRSDVAKLQGGLGANSPAGAANQFPTYNPRLSAHQQKNLAQRQQQLLHEKLPEANRDFRRKPLTVSEYSTIKAHRNAGNDVPDYPPIEPDLAAIDYSDQQVRADHLSSMAEAGFDFDESEVDWQRMQVAANSQRRLSTDHEGRTVLQYKRPFMGWRNAGDIRIHDPSGELIKPPLQASSSGQPAIFSAQAKSEQVQEALNWIPSYSDGSNFYPSERPTYAEDGTLVSGGKQDPAFRAKLDRQRAARNDANGSSAGQSIGNIWASDSADVKLEDLLTRLDDDGIEDFILTLTNALWPDQ